MTRETMFDIVLGVLTAAGLALILCGCATAGSQPAKSQTLTFRDNTINVYLPASTNDAAVASIEIGTQAQAVESSGQETYSPTASPENSTTPSATLSTSNTGSGIASLVSGAVSGLVSGLSGSSDSTDSTDTSSSSSSSDCTDGSCTE